jgi:hypothetical protein
MAAKPPGQRQPEYVTSAHGRHGGVVESGVKQPLPDGRRRLKMSHVMTGCQRRQPSAVIRVFGTSHDKLGSSKDRREKIERALRQRRRA